MRAYEFTKPILLEYNRAITLSNTTLVKNLVNKFVNGNNADHDLFTHWHSTDVRTHRQYNNLPEYQQQNSKQYYSNILRVSNLDNTVDAGDVLPVDETVVANSILKEIEEIITKELNNNMLLKYIPWLVREYMRNNIKLLEDMGGALEILGKYDIVKKRSGFPVEYKDIMRVSYNKEFRNTVRGFNPDDPVGYGKTLGDYDVIYGKLKYGVDENEDPTVEIVSDVVIIHPKNETAAIYFGRYFGGFAEWCTAYVPPQTNRFDYYNKKGPLYIIIPREPTHENEKYQLHGNGNEYKDEDDDDIDTNELLIDRFPEIRETVLELIPQLKDSVYFAPDKVLENIWSAIGELAYDYAITDSIFNTELNDNNYLEYQLEYAVRKGYFNPDIDPDRLEDIQNGDVTPDWDDIDQDKLSDDPEMDYLENNYELGSMIRSYDIFRKSSAREIRGYAVDYSNENNDSPLVNKLDDVYSYALESDSDFKNQEDLILYTKNNIDILNVSLDHDNTTAYLKRNGWIEHTQYGNYVLYRKR